MSYQSPSLLDTCQLFVLLVKVFSALLFQSEESPWKCLSKECVRALTDKLIPSSKPLFKNGMSQNAKVIIRNTCYISYALETNQIATDSEDPDLAASSVHVMKDLGS